MQYLRQTTFESELWNQGSTICVEEQCYHTQDGIFMGHVTVPQTHPPLFLLIMCSWKVLMTLVIDYSFVASSHTAWATGSLDQSELRIHLFAPRSTINDSL